MALPNAELKGLSSLIQTDYDDCATDLPHRACSEGYLP